MKLVFHVADKDRNWELAQALTEGARSMGDTVIICDQREFTGVGDEDAGACLGVKRAGKRLLSSYTQAKKRFAFFDKGMMRREKYVRVALDSWHSLAYFQKVQRPPDRFNALGIGIQPMVEQDASTPNGRFVIFAGSSQKYCNFHDLGDANSYASRACRKIRKNTARPVVYRPKPSHQSNHPEECPPIDGTRYSVGKPLSQELPKAHLLVTHGSNAALDALAAGIPIMVLGEGICKPMSMGELWHKVDDPLRPGDAERRQFFYNAAYCQWTLDELKSGVAWRDMRATWDRMPLAGEGPEDTLEYLVKQYQEMHEQPKYFRGRDAQKHFARIGRLILQHQPRTLLDYGCGKGEQYDPPNSLQEAWDVAVTCYDPGVPKFEELPDQQFDAVICCDVMEHIPEPHVEHILQDVVRRARRFAFFSIATTPASKCLPDGRNCHLTVRPTSWWEARLEKVKAAFPNVDVQAWIQPDPETPAPFSHEDDDD